MEISFKKHAEVLSFYFHTSSAWKHSLLICSNPAVAFARRGPDWPLKQHFAPPEGPSLSVGFGNNKE